MKIVRLGDGSLAVKIVPGYTEIVLGLGALLPLWIFPTDPDLETPEIVAVLTASVLCLVMFAYVAEITVFIFDPARKELSWKRKVLCKALAKGRLAFEGRLRLEDISEIEVVSRQGSGGDYEVHQVVLSVPSGNVPLSKYFSTGRGQHETAAKIIVAFLNEHGYYPRMRGMNQLQ